MKAARFYDKGDIRIEDIPEPVVEAGTVGIQVAWCGICGTDLHEFIDGPIFIPACGHPHPISGESAPITMGHEFSGVVYAVGEGVDDIQVGQHVVVEPYIIADDVPTGPGDQYHLSKNMGITGLAAAASIVSALETIILMGILRKRLGNIGEKSIFSSLIRMIVAGGVMALAVRCMIRTVLPLYSGDPSRRRAMVVPMSSTWLISSVPTPWMRSL